MRITCNVALMLHERKNPLLRRVRSLVSLWSLPDAPATKDLDTPEGVRARARMIHTRKLLKRFYRNCYNRMKSASRDLPPGLRIEIGSGGGFIGSIIPGVLETDVMSASSPALIMSAARISFRDSSLAAVYALNVLHHIPDPDRLFQELIRVLKPGGAFVAVEPANTVLSSFVYRNFHHEPFDPTAGWRLPDGKGPMTASNQALPWILFARDRAEFEARYPQLKLELHGLHSGILYILSGGVSLRQLVPTFCGPLVDALESALRPISSIISLFMTVRITKRSN